MNVPLNPNQEELINRKVQSGLYQSPDEVIDTALTLLDERDRHLITLRQRIWRQVSLTDESAVADRSLIETYTPERIAGFLLNNAADSEDYQRAREEVEKLNLDPDVIPHEPPSHQGIVSGPPLSRREYPFLRRLASRQ